MRVLIVEDDSTLRGFVAQGLTREHFIVEQAANSAEAMTIASDNSFDFIITDLKMPGHHDGIWLIRELRKTHKSAIIFVMTGKPEEEDELESLHAGADEYILKPFTLAVFIARLQVWIKRRKDFLSSEVNSTILTAGDVRLNIPQRRAIRGNRSIPLTEQEFRLLQCLIENKGNIVSHLKLFNEVWKSEFVPDTNVVGTAINRLRKKIEMPDSPIFIKTIINSGYLVSDEESDS